MSSRRTIAVNTSLLSQRILFLSKLANDVESGKEEMFLRNLISGFFTCLFNHTLNSKNNSVGM